MTIDWTIWLGLAIAIGIALAVSVVIVVTTALIARVASRRRDWAKALVSRARHPYRLFVTVVLLWVAVRATMPNAFVDHLFLIATIVIGAWLVAALATFGITLAMSRYRTDVPDNRVARRMQTQLALVRRLVYVIIVVLALGSVLLTFDGVQAVGTSLLASAGVVSIVAGLAAQSTLANVIAGMQLAFSDAIRVDDVVIADGEWGRIEEITLTYVVVSIWDQRRLVLPSTYFTTTPFQNWTRKGSELLGAIELDLDWRVRPSDMRKHLHAIVEASDLWDGRTANIQVTDATGGFVRTRLLVSAANSGELWDLRCHVREEMVEWLQSKSPSSLPRTRVLMVDNEPTKSARASAANASANDDRGLFTGTPEAEARGAEFTGAIPVQQKD